MMLTGPRLHTKKARLRRYLDTMIAGGHESVRTGCLLQPLNCSPGEAACLLREAGCTRIEYGLWQIPPSA